MNLISHSEQMNKSKKKYVDTSKAVQSPYMVLNHPRWMDQLYIY